MCSVLIKHSFLSGRSDGCGRICADGESASGPEIVLDFFQGTASSLRDAQGVEEHADDTHHHEAQVGHPQAVFVHEQREGVRDHERRQPADGYAQARGHAPGNQRQHL